MRILYDLSAFTPVSRLSGNGIVSFEYLSKPVYNQYSLTPHKILQHLFHILISVYFHGSCKLQKKQVSLDIFY